MAKQDQGEPVSRHQTVRLQRGNRSERAQYIIETTYALCTEALREPLQQCFEDFEQQLFAMAENAPCPADRQSDLTCRQLMLHKRDVFEQHFIGLLANEFSSFGMPFAAPGITPDTKGWYALEQMIARGETQHGHALRELAQRLAALMAAPPLEGGALPFGPRALTCAFHHASAELSLPTEHHLLWLGSFSQAVIQTLTRLYDTINRQLQSAGISTRLSEILPSTQDCQPQHLDGITTASTQAAISINSGERPQVPSGMTTDALESIRDLLMQQGCHFQTALGQVSARMASDNEVQQALMTLQASPAYGDNPTRNEIRSAGQLREDLLVKLNASLPDGGLHIQLDDQQNNALELIGLLFEQLGRQLSNSGAARTLMCRLHLPILRMAIADQSFFDQPEHPAQQLLGTIASATHEWLVDGDDGADAVYRPLAMKLENVVDRVWREPASADLYAELLTDIEPQLNLLSDQVSTTEHLSVVGLPVEDPLNLVQRRVSDILTERFAQSPLQRLTRAVLLHVWTDVLAQTLFRNGEHSDAFRIRLAITDQLLGYLPIVDSGELQQEVEAALEQIGLSTEEAADVARKLRDGCTPDSAVTSLNTPDPAIDAEGHKQLFGVSTAFPAALDATSNTAASAIEQQIEERLRTLPFGSWLEVLDAASGIPTQSKLAWYSLTSGRCLLVSRQDQHDTQTTLAQLAKEIAGGHMREVPEQPGTLLDQAWRNLANKLRAQPNTTQNAESEQLQP